jgi:hypothetical protein
MDINQFNSSVNNFLSAVRNNGPEINATITQSGLSLIRDRILDEGIKGEKYSTDTLPYFYFIGKSISDGGEAKAKSKNKANKYKGISYTDFREANNLQTNHVDLRFSGDMWRDMAVLETKTIGSKIITEAGSKNSITYKDGQTTGKIVEYLSDRYGDFLTPTKEEENILDNSLDEELQNLINQFFI